MRPRYSVHAGIEGGKARDVVLLIPSAIIVIIIIIVIITKVPAVSLRIFIHQANMVDNKQ